MSPPGSHTMLQGDDIPLATTTTRIFWPSAVSNSNGLSGSGTGGIPFGATGVPPRPRGTVCCAEPTLTIIRTSAITRLNLIGLLGRGEYRASRRFATDGCGLRVHRTYGGGTTNHDAGKRDRVSRSRDLVIPRADISFRKRPHS